MLLLYGPTKLVWPKKCWGKNVTLQIYKIEI